VNARASGPLDRRLDSLEVLEVVVDREDGVVLAGRKRELEDVLVVLAYGPVVAEAELVERADDGERLEFLGEVGRVDGEARGQAVARERANGLFVGVVRGDEFEVVRAGFVGFEVDDGTVADGYFAPVRSVDERPREGVGDAGAWVSWCQFDGLADADESRRAWMMCR